MQSEMGTRSGRRLQESEVPLGSKRKSKPTVKVRERHREKDEREHTRRRHKRREDSRTEDRDQGEVVYTYKSSKDVARELGSSKPSIVRRSSVAVPSSKTKEPDLRRKPHRGEGERRLSSVATKISEERHGRRRSEKSFAMTKGDRSREKYDYRESVKKHPHRRREEEPLRNRKGPGIDGLPRSSKDNPTLARSSSAREQPSSASHRPHLTRSKTTSTSRQPPTPSHAPSVHSKVPSKAELPPSQTSHDPPIKRSERPASIMGSLFGAPKHSGPPKPEKKVECLTCLTDEPLSKTTHLPCGHNLCNACMKRLFNLSITDPTQMPPKCCDPSKPIELTKIEHLFDRSFKRKWNKKFAEYTTKNRLYCPTRGCGAWIEPRYIFLDRSAGPNGGRRYGVCKSCKTRVCCTCNNKYHTSRECPKDPATQEFLKTAKEQGWQRCYSCKATVELVHGCNHMTCRCGAEFCMVCGIKWKGCACVLFDDTMIDRDRQEHLQGEPAWLRDGWAIPGVWDAFGGDPIMNRQNHREQERRDEELERLFQAMGLDQENNNNANQNDVHVREYGVGNAAGHFMNEHFVRRAHEILTANYNPAQNRAAERLVAEVRRNAQWNAAPPPPRPAPEPARPHQRPHPPRPLRRHSTISRTATNNNNTNNDNRNRNQINSHPHRRSALDHLDQANGAGPATSDSGTGSGRRASTMAGIDRGQSGDGRVDEWRRHVEVVI